MSSDSDSERSPSKIRRLVIRARDDDDISSSDSIESGREHLESQSRSRCLDLVEEDTATRENVQVATTSGDSANLTNNIEEENFARTSGEPATNGDIERCPICWLPYTDQEIATPSVCDHPFCLDCIMEWSITANTCPVDRLRFGAVIVRPHNGSSQRQIPLTNRRTHFGDPIPAGFSPLIGSSNSRRILAGFSPPMDRIEGYNSSPADQDENPITDEESVVLEDSGRSMTTGSVRSMSPDYRDYSSNYDRSRSHSPLSAILCLSPLDRNRLSPSQSNESSAAQLEFHERSSPSSESNESSAAHLEFHERSSPSSESNELFSPSLGCHESFLSPSERSAISTPHSEYSEFLSSPDNFELSLPSDSGGLLLVDSDCNELPLSSSDCSDVLPSSPVYNEFFSTDSNESSPASSICLELFSSCSDTNEIPPPSSVRNDLSSLSSDYTELPPLSSDSNALPTNSVEYDESSSSSFEPVSESVIFDPPSAHSVSLSSEHSFVSLSSSTSSISFS